MNFMSMVLGVLQWSSNTMKLYELLWMTDRCFRA